LFEDDSDLRKGSFWTGAAARLGVYLHPYHNMFMNAAITDADVAKVLDVTERAFELLRTNLPTLGPQPNPKLAQRLQMRRSA
ncbi:MAG: hypothetical protein RLZZ444_511, partial [Pseudomonadota bacterium]